MKKILVAVLTAIYLLISLGSRISCAATMVNKAERLSLEQISVGEGLPHTDVGAILQDRTGYMWIATYAGLCRYDGIRFTNYNVTNSILKSSRILCLYLSADNLLYIGTETGGVTVYDTVAEKFIKTISVPRDGVNGIFGDPSGKVWLCTEDGISCLSIEGGGHELISWSFGYRVSGGCATSREGNLLLATRRGIQTFDGSRITSTYSADHCTSVCRLPGEKYFVTSLTGCYVFDSLRNAVDRVNDTAAITAVSSSDGDILVGTCSDGILHLDSRLNMVVSYFPGRGENSFHERFNITSLFFDSSSVLWIGTIGNGCYKSNVNSRRFKCYSLDSNASRHPVSCMFADRENRLWVSFRDGSLAVFDDGELTLVDKSSIGAFQSLPVSSMYEAEDGSLWLGSWSCGALIIPVSQKDAACAGRQFNVSRPVGVPSDISIFKFARTNCGDIWMSTNRGACRIPKGSSTVEEYSFNPLDDASVVDDYSTDIIVDERGSKTIVWLGSKRGVTRFFCDTSTGKPERIKRLHPSTIEGQLYGEYVSFIYKSAAGEIWISTLGGGLNRLVSDPFEDNPSFQLFNKVNFPFPNNEFESLQEDDEGNFWIGGQGLIKFNPASGELDCYTKNDGLQSNVFKIWDSTRFPDGRLAFGGIDGFNVFLPSSIVSNSISPEVVLTGIKVNGKDFDPETTLSGDERFVFTHRQNSYTFDFAALHYVSPTRNTYRYRLSGAEQEWHSTDGKSASATYTSLRPGTYTFEVYGANPDGYWSANPAALCFVIRPPFYRSPFAYLLYLLIIAGAIFYFVYSSRLRSEHRHQLEMERHLRLEQQRRNENELRFQTEFLHEVKTPLTLIKAPVEELLQNGSLGKNTQSRLKLVLQSANILQKDIEAVTDLRRYDNGYVSLRVVEVDFCRFVEEIVLLFQPVAKSRGIDLSLSLPEEGVKLFLDKEQMEKVILNLMSNAIKFSPEQGGCISVSISQFDGKAVLKVSNIGMGILPEDIDRIFNRFVQGKNNNRGGLGIGLAISKHVVESHGGTISVSSVPGGDTVFSVVLPLGDSHFSPDDIDRDYQNSDHLSNYDAISEFDNPGPVFARAAEKNSTVLVVDDNSGLISYYTRLLSSRYNVISASNGLEGYGKALSEQPDLILTDVVMPYMNGLELCSKIKNNSDTAHIPVILISARDLPVHKIEGYQMLADDYLTKPFHADVLLSRIENMILQRENMKRSFRAGVSLEPSAVTATPIEEKFIRRCIEAIEKNMGDTEFGVEELCAEVGCSRPQLYRRIKSITGQSAIHFIRTVRLKRAAQIFSANRGIPVSQVMEEIGFSNASYFSKIFFEEFGVLPKDYGE